MKTTNNRKSQTKKSTSIIGLTCSAVGLAFAALVILQLAPVLIAGKVPVVSSMSIALETTLALTMLMVGFALMVIGANPFEDVTGEFDYLQDTQDQFPTAA